MQLYCVLTYIFSVGCFPLYIVNEEVERKSNDRPLFWKFGMVVPSYSLKSTSFGNLEFKQKETQSFEKHS